MFLESDHLKVIEKRRGKGYNNVLLNREKKSFHLLEKMRFALIGFVLP